MNNTVNKNVTDNVQLRSQGWGGDKAALWVLERFRLPSRVTRPGGTGRSVFVKGAQVSSLLGIELLYGGAVLWVISLAVTEQSGGAAHIRREKMTYVDVLWVSWSIWARYFPYEFLDMIFMIRWSHEIEAQFTRWLLCMTRSSSLFPNFADYSIYLRLATTRTNIRYYFSITNFYEYF